MLTWFVAAAFAAGPVFSLRDGDVAVPVTAYALPEAPAPAALTVCDVQWRMRSGADPQRTISGCDGAWRDAVDKASAAWVLAPPEAALRDGDAVRHATFYAWPDGAVRVALWGTRASDQTPLPAGVVYGRQPDATKRYPLEIPDELKVGVEAVDCRIRMSVDVKGKPSALEGGDCPTALRDDAVKLASQWRFAPALVDEKPVPAPYYVAARWRKPAPPPEKPFVGALPEGPMPLPEGVAFRLHHGAADKVDVTAWAMPAPMAGGLQHCDASFRLAGAVTQITVDGCAGPFAAAVEAAAAKWKFGPPELKEGQPFTTFRVSFYAFPDGHVRTVLWNTFEADEVELPEGVVYGDLPGINTFVNPKYPELGGERLTVYCLFTVSMDERGAVLGITPESCDEPWLTPALAALSKWDFKPAKVEDVKVPFTWHDVSVKFSPDPLF